MRVRGVKEKTLDAPYDTVIYMSRAVHPSDKDSIEDEGTIYGSVFGSSVALPS